MVVIKFKAQGSNSLIGGFDHGDIARVGVDIASHLVEIGVADYINATVKQESDSEPVKRVRKTKETK